MKISNRYRTSLVVILIAILQIGFLNGYGQIKPESPPVETFDASNLDWELWGYRPDAWRMNFDFQNFSGGWAEYREIPFDVPGSVRNSLLKAGIIEDWNVGLNSSSSEWIGNRHWIIAARIPDHLVGTDRKITLQCDGLDQLGTVRINGIEAGSFDNAFIPYSFDIKPYLKEHNNTIAFVFECPPQDLDQIGFTSEIKDWKPRFYYGWDWIPRIVQIGIWDRVWITTSNHDLPEINDLHVETDADPLRERGELKVKAHLNQAASEGTVHLLLTDSGGKKLFEETIPGRELTHQVVRQNLKIKRWWPNGSGNQHLYKLQVTLLDSEGVAVQELSRRIGFRNITWLPCEGASADADPWICSVNSKPIFLQGINWTPIRPNFADLKEEDYRQRLETYRELGVNTIRVWGGGFAEKEWLYDLCDELGIMIWQDFPLSSSGIDNYPPEGVDEVFEMSKIVRHYVSRLQHHPGLLLWCGGNELYNRENTTPIKDDHIMIGTMKEIVNTLDPGRRFVTGSPSGPNISATRNNFGSGNNWDTHGPWKLPITAEDRSMEGVKKYWKANDALFISEAGAPGAMSAEMIMKYSGSYDPLPANLENPLWRNVNWWVDWDEYKADHDGKEPESLEAYVGWSQERQLQGLTIAMKSFKDRFPSCGGFLIWMGHDSFPCMVNTSIIDFEGNRKPAADELEKIWKSEIRKQ